VDQLLESGRHIELILGVRISATDPVEAFEYLVKWAGHAHIHNTWMEEVNCQP
jgi:hypothetical protein